MLNMFRAFVNNTGILDKIAAEVKLMTPDELSWE